MSLNDVCPFCHESLSDARELTIISQQRAIGSIFEAATLREIEPPHVVIGTRVHTACRREFTDKKRIQIHNKRRHEDCEDTTPRNIRRRSQFTFDFKHLCFFCTCPCHGIGGGDDRHPSRYDTAFAVRTTCFQNQVHGTCLKRQDEWAMAVLGRIEFVQDLHAADAVYHKVCSTNFMTGKNIPVRYQTNLTEVDRKTMTESRLLSRFWKSWF